MVNHFVAGHPHAVIGDGQRALVFIERDTNAQFAITFVQVRVR